VDSIRAKIFGDEFHGRAAEAEIENAEIADQHCGNGEDSILRGAEAPHDVWNREEAREHR